MHVNASCRRWDEMLRGLAGLLPPGTASVLVDGHGEQPAVLATRLAAVLNASGRAGVRVHSGRDDGTASWDVVIWVRTAAERHGARGGRDAEDQAGIVIDMHDPDWPVIRRVADPLAARGTSPRPGRSSRAGPPPGTPGSAMTCPATPPPSTRPGSPRAVWSSTLAAAPAGRCRPFATASADAIFAAGLINHLPDTEAGLRELARVTRPGGLLILFHPSGRAALAARRGRTLSPDEPLAAGPLLRSTQATGWQLTAYDDAADRFFAVAIRR